MGSRLGCPGRCGELYIGVRFRAHRGRGVFGYTGDMNSPLWQRLRDLHTAYYLIQHGLWTPRSMAWVVMIAGLFVGVVRFELNFWHEVGLPLTGYLYLGMFFGTSTVVAVAVCLLRDRIPFSPVGKAKRRERLRREGRCSECGYDLRATINRCPECGTAYSPYRGALPK